MARSTSSFWLNAVSSTTGAMRSLAMCSAALIPSILGIFTSMSTTSGRCSWARETASSPLSAWATTSNPWAERISTMSSRIRASSSATTTRRTGRLDSARVVSAAAGSAAALTSMVSAESWGVELFSDIGGLLGWCGRSRKKGAG